MYYIYIYIYIYVYIYIYTYIHTHFLQSLHFLLLYFQLSVSIPAALFSEVD